MNTILKTPSKIDLSFAERNVIFTISDCSLHKKLSFFRLSRTEAKMFIERLKHFEKMTWRQLSGLDRRRGLTVEDPNSDNFKMIQEQDSSIGKIVEQHYFHFRVGQDNLFRVFGYQKKQFFCITHIDPSGRINH